MLTSASAHLAISYVTHSPVLFLSDSLLQFLIRISLLLRFNHTHRRAGSCARPSYNPLEFKDISLLETMLRCCIYQVPPNLLLPRTFTPPQLLITKNFWTWSTTILMIASFNPSTYGKEIWTKFPTYRSNFDF